MPDRLAVGADHVDVLRPQSGLPDGRQGGLGVKLPQEEVHIANLVHGGRLRAEQGKNLLPHRRRIGLVFKGQQLHLRLSGAPADLHHSGVYAVHRSAGHHANHPADRLFLNLPQHHRLPPSAA